MKKALTIASCLVLAITPTAALAGPDNGDGDVTDPDTWKEIVCLITGDALPFCNE